ncbi:hypothetical protein [Microtetraspora sp. NBRC 13810]|uniref:hypothetical protein n=1 Tax=Microtetraspora sp. NBRC 13810 TaxID=3030990 RepID=UPI0025523EE0|nr:hypothetical protein [Microtetraspora sp. NBRC 13810]
MRDMGKGALVGLAVGVTQAVLWTSSPPWDGHSGVRGPSSLVLTVAVFLIAAITAPLVRLRRRSLTVIIGGIATLALGQALWRIAPETISYGFDRSLLGGVHLTASLAGFSTAAWALAAARRWWSRIAALGVLTAVCALTVPLAEPAWRWHLARAFELLEVPLVAPDIAEHRLFYAETPVVGDTEPVILLEYRRTGAERESGSFEAIQVTVRRGSAGTAAEACATPYQAESWGAPDRPCREAAPNRWVRHGPRGRIAVFTHSGGALVQVESHGVGQAALLAAAGTIRPTTAETLAEYVLPVR